MVRLYEGYMNYLVYRIFAGDGTEPLYVLIAQFDQEEDVQLYIDAKSKVIDRKYGVLKNEKGSVIEERMPFLTI